MNSAGVIVALRSHAYSSALGSAASSFISICSARSSPPRFPAIHSAVPRSLHAWSAACPRRERWQQRVDHLLKDGNREWHTQEGICADLAQLMLVHWLARDPNDRDDHVSCPQRADERRPIHVRHVIVRQQQIRALLFKRPECLQAMHTYGHRRSRIAHLDEPQQKGLEHGSIMCNDDAVR